MLSYVLYSASFQNVQGSDQKYILNVTPQFLVFVDDSLFGENTNTVNKSSGAVMETVLEVNTVQLKYMPQPRHQNAVQNSDNSKIWKLQISRVTVTIEKCIHEEVKIKFDECMAHSAHSFPCSRLPK